MGAKRRFIDFELPPKLLQATNDYLGPRIMNKLTPEQRSHLVTIVNTAGADVAEVVEKSKSG